MADRLAMLEQLIESGSTDPFHHYARALELRSRGQLQDALSALSDVSQKFPDYVPTYLMAGQLAEELGEKCPRISSTSLPAPVGMRIKSGMI